MTLPCPHCQKPLNSHVDSETGEIVVWCARGDCTSRVTNDGGRGATIQEALDALNKAWEAEDLNQQAAEMQDRLRMGI